MSKKKLRARERASKLLEYNSLEMGPEGKTYQLRDNDTGEINKDPFIGVDMGAGLFSRNRRQNKLIGRELIMQRNYNRKPKEVVPDPEPKAGTGDQTKGAGSTDEQLKFKDDPQNGAVISEVQDNGQTTSTKPVSIVEDPKKTETPAQDAVTPAVAPAVASEETSSEKPEFNLGDIEIGWTNPAQSAIDGHDDISKQVGYDVTPYLENFDAYIKRSAGNINLPEPYERTTEGRRKWFMDNYPDQGETYLRRVHNEATNNTGWDRLLKAGNNNSVGQRIGAHLAIPVFGGIVANFVDISKFNDKLGEFMGKGGVGKAAYNSARFLGGPVGSIMSPMTSGFAQQYVHSNAHKYNK